jgi:hypothetical protein
MKPADGPATCAPRPLAGVDDRGQTEHFPRQLFVVDGERPFGLSAHTLGRAGLAGPALFDGVQEFAHFASQPHRGEGLG